MLKICYEKGVCILYIEKELVKVFNFFGFLIIYDVIYVLIILGEKILIYFNIERSVNLEFLKNFVSIKIIYINYWDLIYKCKLIDR